MFPGGMWTNMPNNNGYRADHDVDEQTNFAEFTVTEHLDRYDFDVGILTGQDLYRLPATTNLDYAAALCRAYNDWTLEHWIATDERFRMILTVGPNDPIQAVQEIDRLGGHPAVVGVMFPAGGRYPYGNRMYHPIYEAAERHGLVMVTHFGGEGVGANNAPTAAGYPTYYLEMRMARPQIAQAHVTSLICEGVFEKYTDLKWVFVEVDTWWIPGLLDHFDADWKALRDYTPWVKQLPSEYFRKHIRVGTQPWSSQRGGRISIDSLSRHMLERSLCTRVIFRIGTGTSRSQLLQRFPSRSELKSLVPTPVRCSICSDSFCRIYRAAQPQQVLLEWLRI